MSDPSSPGSLACVLCRQGAEQAVAQAEAEVRQCAPSEGQPRGPAADAADHARQSAMALAQYAAATVDTFTPAQVRISHSNSWPIILASLAAWQTA